MKIFRIAVAGAVLLLAGCTVMTAEKPSLGIFEQHADIGDTHIAGAAVRDGGRYTVTGGGANLWGGVDAFHFVWKRMSGDLSIASDVAWIGTGGAEHRKAGVMIRQSLSPDSPYVDLMVHGNGYTSLQWRDEPGGATHEIGSLELAPKRIKLERVGAYVYMSLADPDGRLRFAGGSIRVKLTGPYYVGLAVCAHDNAASETAIFSNVEIAPIASTGERPSEDTATVSTLEVLDMDLFDRHVVYNTDDLIEAPNWSPDGKFLLFNGGGRLYAMPLSTGPVVQFRGEAPRLVDTGALSRLNNDHGISPGGRRIVVSDQSQPDNKSRVHVLAFDPQNFAAGESRLITPEGPSYWHAWSPDGKTLVVVGLRDGDYDLFAVPADGHGREVNLTRSPGLDDGPDYSPDGKFIYFNSVRSGNMKIWRIDAGGGNPVQLTSDPEYRDWFPHPSPDGKWIVFVSFPVEQVALDKHPRNKDVVLRAMPASGGEPKVIARLFGGQGTMNVPSWSPDGKYFAFVSYRPVAK